MNLVVDGLNNEAKLNAIGEKIAEANLVGTLATRLRVEDYIEKHPEVLSHPIEKPLFVLGPPRTGTTLLINLLSVDPALRCLLRWESSDPVPPPKNSELHAGPRFEKVRVLAVTTRRIFLQWGCVDENVAGAPVWQGEDTLPMFRI